MNSIRALRRAVIVAVAATCGLGCGKNRVTLDIDVLSFMDPAETQSDYNAPPAVPTQVRLEPFAVQLLEGYDDLGTAQEATLDVAVQYDNQTGQGRGRIVIYFGDDPATVYSTVPVATLEADLLPAQMTTGSLQIQADQRVLDLFTSRSFHMGMDLEWEPQGVAPLAGTSMLTRINARVVSRLDLL
jgi:hypothetical protein